MSPPVSTARTAPAPAGAGGWAHSDPAPGPEGRRGPPANPAILVAGGILAAYVVAALVAPLLVADPNAADVTARLAPPSRSHLLGTDQLGRDVAARLLHGARVSLVLAAATTAATAVLGLALGLLAATSHRLVDSLVMRVVDVVQALPGLLLALALVGVLGPSLRNLVIAIVAVWWAGYARMVRAIALSARERDYVEASRALGASEWRLLRRHILPSVLGPAVVLTTLDLGRTLLAVSGLSFLGLGARPPSPEWGAMLSEARSYLDQAPQLLLYPGLAITLFVLASNLLGDGLRDRLDPRSASGPASRGGRW